MSTTLTPAQRDAIAAVHIAVDAERRHGTPAGTGSDAVWRDHFRDVLEQVAAAFPQDGPS